MKTLRLLSFFLLVVGGMGFSAARAESTAPVSRGPTIQMKVDVPFNTDLIHRDEMADALFWRVRDGIRTKLRGVEIEEADGSEAAKDKPLLTLTLIHWRQNRMGDIECQFTAEYSSFDGKLSLGTFEGVTSAIVRSRGFEGEDFVKAAEDAGRNLGEVLRKQKLL